MLYSLILEKKCFTECEEECVGEMLHAVSSSFKTWIGYQVYLWKTKLGGKLIKTGVENVQKVYLGVHEWFSWRWDSLQIRYWWNFVEF